MRSLCTALLVLLALSSVSAQEMPKANFVEMFAQVPAPPADAKEAYARCKHSADPNSPAVDATKYYQSMSDKLQELQREISIITAQLAQPMMDQAKKVDTKEMQKKMKNMSQEERIKYALQMNQEMGLAPKPMVPEPSKVKEAFQEAIKLSQEASEDIQKAGDDMQNRRKVEEDRAKKHNDVDQWYKAEAAKLPQLSTGEMSYAEPKALHALKLKAADKHVALENDYLKDARKSYQDELARWKTRYSPMQKKLQAIHYGDDAKNAETKRSLLGADNMMVNAAISLLKTSLGATKESAEWYAKKIQVEKEKEE